MNDLPEGISRISDPDRRPDPVAEGLTAWAHKSRQPAAYEKLPLPEGIERIERKKPRPPRIKRKQRKMQFRQGEPFKISSWRAFVNWLTGRQHHYQLTIRYSYEQDENGHWPDSKYISRTIFVSFPDPALLHNNHALNKELAPSLIKQIPRIYLRNGLIQIQNVNFLGVW